MIKTKEYTLRHDDEISGYEKLALVAARTECIHVPSKMNVVTVFNVLGENKYAPIGEVGDVFEVYFRPVRPINEIEHTDENQNG